MSLTIKEGKTIFGGDEGEDNASAEEEKKVGDGAGEGTEDASK